ncbi:pyridoxamine 5'-phosphate oxidase family protein [Halobacteriales archaeon QH_10_70_21]|nr:MAG: pyridoxamine 5'-phosphate oxidase family protein [Halobacteriales archaeon QH_10_70_21]
MTIDQLTEYGLEPMDDESIREFLSAHSTGVLGLPTESEPYLLPLSCGYDGDSSLYFTYLLGESSWTAELTDAAESARFLAYSVETQFNWRSVLLTGDASAVPEEKWSDVEPLTQNAWRPNTLQAASTTGGVAVYEFRVRERDGIQQNGLAPEFRENIEP